MFNIGGSEMVVLAILALLVFGPEGLPGIVKNVVRTVKALRAAASDFQTEVKTALEIENERADKAARRRKTVPRSLEGMDSESTSETLPQEPSPDKETLTDEDQASASAEEPGENLSEQDSQASPPEEAPDFLSEVLEEEPSQTTKAQEPELEVEAEARQTESEPVEELDDDGPGLPMVRKKVGETA